MKKAFKVIIITLLVIASVALTVFAFYKNHEDKKRAEVSFVDVVYSDSKQVFDEKVYEAISLASAISDETRFANFTVNSIQDDVYGNTYFENMDKALLALASYYAEDEFKVKIENITSTYNNLISARNLLEAVAQEYKLKYSSEYFKDYGAKGANDLFKSASKYLSTYADFIIAISDNLNNSDLVVISDVKFAMINIYAHIVKITFNDMVLNETTKIYELTQTSNFEEIFKYFNLENSHLITGDVYSEEAINFVENYNACDKTAFAKNLASNLEIANSISESSTSLQKAVYYFKQLFVV